MKPCIVSDSVSSFRYRGKTYLPGALVELPDNFPIHLYPFLKSYEYNHDEGIRKYQRPKPITIKPLLAVMSVRRIPKVLKAFEKLDFLDKVYFRNFTPAVVSSQINKFIDNHLSTYTHIIVTSDDIAPSPENIKQLICDVANYDFPVIAGYCNQCEFNRQDQHGCICGNCVDNKPHRTTNVTIDPVNTVTLSRNSYKFLPMEWTVQHQGIFRVWFQGMACGVVSIETHKQVPFRSWNKGNGGLMQDLALAFDLHEHDISQFVDFRVGIRHYGTHHGQLLVGKEPSRIDFEAKKT